MQQAATSHPVAANNVGVHHEAQREQHVGLVCLEGLCIAIQAVERHPLLQYCCRNGHINRVIRRYSCWHAHNGALHILQVECSTLHNIVKDLDALVSQSSSAHL